MEDMFVYLGLMMGAAGFALLMDHFTYARKVK
jgi:hypothetical protein